MGTVGTSFSSAFTLVSAFPSRCSSGTRGMQKICWTRHQRSLVHSVYSYNHRRSDTLQCSSLVVVVSGGRGWLRCVSGHAWYDWRLGSVGTVTLCGGTLIARQTDDDATMAQQSKHYVASPQASTRAVTGCWLPGRRCGGTETPGSTCQVVCYERRWISWFLVTARRLNAIPGRRSRRD